MMYVCVFLRGRLVSVAVMSSLLVVRCEYLAHACHYPASLGLSAFCFLPRSAYFIACILLVIQYIHYNIVRGGHD